MRRVAVIAPSKVFSNKLSKLSEGSNVEFVPVLPKKSLPACTAGIVVSAAKQEPKEVFDAACHLAGQHEEMLFLLADVIDAQNGFPAGGSRRIYEHAERFAEALELSTDEYLALTRAALVGNIGMMRVPVDLLFKKVLLTYDEWATLHSHPVFGAEILSKMGAFADIAEIVRTHHECYDGTGYPLGIEGEEIPRLARALKILDVYCAMTSPRHYRETHASHEEAVGHLMEERGKHFDPELIDVFIEKKVGRTE